ncbi:MAG: hypothetical protein QGI21_02280 [Candidatus Poseidoniaceae archaeon]|jgi:hypothetical protein|nr:hypothetical protein [Candidatus Poseidoniaceae archaeon]
MDIELETWLNQVMEKQQYRSGIKLGFGLISLLRLLPFGSVVKPE